MTLSGAGSPISAGRISIKISPGENKVVLNNPLYEWGHADDEMVAAATICAEAYNNEGG